jgi:nicotinamide-nucleotide amidase
LRLRLTTSGDDVEELERNISKVAAELYKIIPDIIVGEEGNESIEKLIGKKLMIKNQTLSIAESCTGGHIAKLVTAIPGASAYFVGGVVAYSRKLKQELLGVSEELVNKYSVVSEEVALAMVVQIRQSTGSDYAIATTGNAGPTKDATDESVGTVYIAIAGPRVVFTKKYFFGKPREKVIERASNKALELLYAEILKN